MPVGVEVGEEPIAIPIAQIVTRFPPFFFGLVDCLRDCLDSASSRAARRLATVTWSQLIHESWLTLVARN